MAPRREREREKRERLDPIIKKSMPTFVPIDIQRSKRRVLSERRKDARSRRILQRDETRCRVVLVAVAHVGALLHPIGTHDGVSAIGHDVHCALQQ